MSEVSGTTAEREDAVRVSFEIEVYNPTYARAEKVLDIAVPPTAAVDRFGMWVQGRYMEGEIAPRAEARRVFERYAYGRGVDPALLTWVRADLCRARVFPIFPRSSTRLLLSYVVPRSPGGSLVLPSPLADIELATAEVDSFRRVFRGRSQRKDDETPRVRAYRPKADEASYFSAELRLPEPEVRSEAADLTLVLRDTSFSMRDREYQFPPIVMTRPLPTWHEIDFDFTPRGPRTVPAWRLAPSENGFDGATDIGAAFDSAAQFLDGREFRRARVVLVSDGEDTCGEPNPMNWTAPLDRFGPERVSVWCLKPDARIASALGRYHRAWRKLANVSAEGIEGIRELGAAFHAQIEPGGIIRVYGRCERPEGRLKVSYGMPDGSLGDREYSLTFDPSNENTHLPGLWARARIDDLELAASLTQDPAERAAATKEAQQLALDHHLLSLRTSVLVLESERDFRESGVERKERVEGWAEADTGAIRTAPAEWSAWTPPSGACFISVEEDDPHVLRLDRAYREILGSWGAWHYASYREDAVSAPRYHPLVPFQVGDLVLAATAGRYTLEPTQRFRTPPCGWIFGSATEERRKPDGSAVALWKTDFGPLSLGPPGDLDNRWIAGRRAETATLLRESTAGLVPACFCVTPEGIETELPSLGLVYLNDPRSAVHASYLLDRFPFPTLLPLEYLAKHYDVTVHGEGATVRVVLAREGEVRLYWVDMESGIPSRVLVLGIHQNSSYELRCRREDSVLIFETPEGVEVGRIAVADAPAGRLHAASTGQGIRVGFLPYSPIWQRVLDGTATPEDLMQLAFAEPDVISRLDHLERAAALAPRNMAVLAFLADCLGTLGRKDEALETVARALALADGVPRYRAECLKLFLAGVQARFTPDKAAPFERLADELEKGSAIGRAASERAASIELAVQRKTRLKSHHARIPFWPTPTKPRKPEFRRYEYKSPEMERVRELLEATDPEGLAEYVLRIPDLILSAGYVIQDSVYGYSPSHPVKWSEEQVVRFLNLMAQSPIGRKHVELWLKPNRRHTEPWCMEKLRERPDWHELAHRYMGFSSIKNESGPSWGYWRFRDAKELASPPFPLRTQLLARMRMMEHYGWALDDLSAYWEETIALIAGIDGDLDRWKATTGLLGRSTRGYVRFLNPSAPGRSVDDVGRMIRACVRLPEAQHLAYFANHGAKLPWSGWGWLDSVARYVVELAREGRVDEAVRQYEALFAAHSPPALRAYLEVAAEDAPLEYENALARARGFMLREKSVSGLADIILREGGRPSPIILREVSRRGIGREVSHECIRRFTEAPHALAWAVFESPRDEEMAREALRAVRSLRAQLSMGRLFARGLLGLCFKNGLLEETIAEAREAEAAAPSETWVSLVRASAVSILDSEEKGVPGWRAVIERLGSSGRAYSAAVSCLKAVHRYQEAYELRKLAVAAHERLQKGAALPETDRYSWEWLETADQKLVDNAVVRRGEMIKLPKTGDFRDELETAAALARWKDYARALNDNFDKLASDEERFAALDRLLQGGSQLREPCPALERWLEKHIAERRPMSTRWGYHLYSTHWIRDVDALLDYAAQFAEQGESELAQRLARAALDRAVNERTSDDTIVRCFRAAVDRFGVSPRTLVGRFSWFRGPSEEVNSILDEAAFDSARDVIESGRWDATWAARITERMDERPLLRQKVDDFARTYVKNGRNAAGAAIVCARTGWGRFSEDECWRIAARDPALLAFDFGEPYLDHLRKTRQWDAALEFLDVLDRRSTHFARRNAGWRADILAAAGRPDDAVSFAREQGLYEWLIEKGEEKLGAAAAQEVMERESCDPESYAFLEAATRLFAVELWHGRPQEAAKVFVKCIPHLTRHTDPSNAFSRVAEFSDYALHPKSREGPSRRIAWKESEEGRAAALAVASALLAVDAEPRGWETTALAGLCCVPAAYQGTSREVRARAYRLLLQAFRRLGRGRQTAVATLLWRNAGGPWHREKPDPLDPLPEHLLASLAAVEACGGFAPRTGLPFEPDYESWGKLPRAKRLELLRRASRLLEVYPASGPVRRNDLSALERYEYPAGLAEDDPDFVPTPRQWLMREMRRRRHLCLPVE